MDFNMLAFGLITGLLMTFVLNWIYFFDWLGLLGKLLHVIAPKRKDKDIEENKKMRKSEEYKIHRRKWKAIFLLAPATFAIVFLIVAAVVQSLLAAYFCGLMVTVIVYGILESIEQKSRKEITSKNKTD